MQKNRLGFLLSALLAVPAFAQTPPEATDTVAFGHPVSEGSLGDLRGGTDTTINDMFLNGVTAGNSANRVVTGNNDIGQGAFSAMSGIPIVIQNTGANVLIQNAVILNLQVN